MRRWKTLRDAAVFAIGLGVLYHQIVATTPSVTGLIVGFALVFLPSTLIAERMMRH